MICDNCLSVGDFLDSHTSAAEYGSGSMLLWDFEDYDSLVEYLIFLNIGEINYVMCKKKMTHAHGENDTCSKSAG